mmetsp:Transcript_6004/g.18961  ORF Transcript_6004/g.18961 Transcript_6004/m.18961 type:complete len:539 (-) Transcript_6004:7-1623(-)
MLSRSQRPPLHTTTTTAEVGPGAYEGPASSIGSPPRHAVAPFGSTSSRAGGGAINVDTNPGPGAYFHDVVSGSRAKLKPSPQFASRQQRIPLDRATVEAQNLPGPGSYTGSVVQPPKRGSARPASGKAMHAAAGINWVKVATAPSIPTVQQSYGYEEGPSGALVLQSGPYKGHTGVGGDVPGPGEYAPNDKPTRHNRNATNFGASVGGRHSPVPRDADKRPGPGSYDFATCGTSDAFRGGVMAQRQTSSFASTSKRAPPARTQEGPGPGSYRTPSTFAPLKEYLATHPESFASFGRTLAEGRPQRPDDAGVPGPGDYDPRVPTDVTAHNSVRKKGLSVLTSKAPRFAASAPSHAEGPGPGSYAVADNTMVAKLGHKINGRFGAFGSTAGRFAPDASAKSTAGDPGAYNPPARLPNPAEARRRDNRSSAFRSTAKRSELAAPTTSATAYYAPQEPSKPTTTSRAFISNQPRFAEARSSDVPGPGQYDPALPTRKAPAGGPDMPKAPRFEATRVDGNPGPGSYETTPSMMRRTFNISVGA